MAIHYPCHFLPVVSGVSNQGRSLYGSSHDVVAVRILELVDDGYFLVGFGFRCYLLIIDNNAGMENLLVNLFPEVIRYAAHECTL